MFYCKGHEDGDIFWPTFHGDLDNSFYVKMEPKTHSEDNNYKNENHGKIEYIKDLADEIDCLIKYDKNPCTRSQFVSHDPIKHLEKRQCMGHYLTPSYHFDM